MYADSPRRLLHFVLDFLASVDCEGSSERRERVDSLLGSDSNWENQAAAMDPTKSVGLSPAATALRIETEEISSELLLHRPEFVARSGKDSYLEAVHYASMVRQLLNYHAELASPSAQRTARLLGMRDAVMADNLAYTVSREHGRGKVLAFAHNSHLKRGEARWQLGADLLTWFPCGAHLDALLGSRYAVIGSAVGVSDTHGIGQPEPNTLEAELTAQKGPARFIPTYRGKGLPSSEIASLPTRSGSTKNSTYFPLTSESLSDFDWLAVLDSTA